VRERKYRLEKDGQVVVRGTKMDCFIWILSNLQMAISEALTAGGYQLLEDDLE
jgi:hypothetical protein